MLDYLRNWWIFLIIIIILFIKITGQERIATSASKRKTTSTKSTAFTVSMDSTKSQKTLKENSILSSRDAIPEIASEFRIDTLSGSTETNIVPKFVPMIPSHIVFNEYNNSSKQQSKGEKECQRVVEEIFGIPFRTQARLPELINPLTNQMLEIDIYHENVRNIDLYQKRY